MPRSRIVADWEGRVIGHFPGLPAPTARALALAGLGMAAAKSGRLNAVLLALAGLTGSAFNALRQRLRGFYKDADFDVTVCFAPLLRWATAGADRRVVLALDPTNLGDRFTVLTVSVVFRSCAVPVAWAVLRGDRTGSWNAHWGRLLKKLRPAFGEGWTVLALTDRGLESKTLFDAIVAAGCHPLMRVKKAGHFRPAGWHKGWPMGRFAESAGSAWSGRGVAWPTGSKLGATLLARRDNGHADAWLILTDLGPADADAGWYAFRAWIEHGFRDLKSDGWELSGTRMTDPDRVSRWWAAAALATLWALEAGQQAERLEVPATRTHAGAGGAAVTSLFALGLAWLARQIGRGRLRQVKPLVMPTWPRTTKPSVVLDERVWLAA